MFVVPAVAGPFDLGTVVVRTALRVDRRMAQITAISDPLPKVLNVAGNGFPLRVRDVRVAIDRPEFARNPTDCSPTSVEGTAFGSHGAVDGVSAPFRAAGCRALGFEPELRLRLVGRRQTRPGQHPSLRALLRQGPGEAGIERAEVRLPKSLALDPNNARGLCEFEDGTRADPENHCPRSSIVGRARAVSPLLKEPLSGPVFFVKNIRIDPRTGNEIRTLPMLIAALRGEVAINLRGESNVKRGKLVNTFATVPDAPVSRFALRLRGGRGGILTVTGRRSLCATRRHLAEVDMDAHSGSRRDFDVRMRTPCRRTGLRVGTARWRGNRVQVRGRVNRRARRPIRVAVRCGRARAATRTRPNRRGWWKATLRLRGRCANRRKAKVVARYAGGPTVKRAARTRAVRRRR